MKQNKNTSGKNIFNKNKSKGQVAIEFIFILLIIVVYIFTVTKPLIESGQDAINDIERINRINSETEKIANSINRVYLLGSGTKETINIFIPQKSQINCFNGENIIGFTSQINENNKNPTIGTCQNNVCDKNMNTFDELILRCQSNTLSEGNYKIIIEKDIDNSIIFKVE